MVLLGYRMQFEQLADVHSIWHSNPGCRSVDSILTWILLRALFRHSLHSTEVWIHSRRTGFSRYSSGSFFVLAFVAAIEVSAPFDVERFAGGVALRGGIGIPVYTH